MSTLMAGHVPLAGHEKIVHAWKLWIAGASIGALFFVGFYLAVTRWQESWEYALILLGSFLGPAVAAAFGYFWCLPEVLGGISATGTERYCKNGLTSHSSARSSEFSW